MNAAAANELAPFQHPSDMMDVDVEDSLGLEHDAPAEAKTDAEFFNDFPDDFDETDADTVAAA